MLHTITLNLLLLAVITAAVPAAIAHAGAEPGAFRTRVSSAGFAAAGALGFVALVMAGQGA